MRYAAALLFAALPACDRDQPPAPTAEQTDQLDEAEAMLNDMAGDAQGNSREVNTSATAD